MIKFLQKLKGRSVAELRVRGAQAFHAASERAGWSAHRRVPADQAFFRLLARARFDRAPLTAESLLTHFRTRPTPNCFAAFAAPAATRAALRERFAGAASDRVLARAQAVKADRFDLLGQLALDFGTPIDWQLEPMSGRRTPLVHWSKLDFLNPQVAGDKKFTWELNRQQYFMTLGRAYWRTGDETYAETFAAHVAAWLDANPPTLGINWASSLEVAFRLISWLWAIHFFKDSPALTPALFLRLLKSLYAHARHIETYLSTYFSPNTHLTGEALGLYYLGTLLPEFKRAAHWRTLGASILLAQLDQHIKPDGVYIEHSTYYQRYTADFYTHFLLLARNNNNEPLPASAQRKLAEKLTALLDHLLYVTRPDGTTPYIGDDDGGRLAPLDDRAPADFRATLATGAALFARGDYKHVAGDAPESLLWLLGADGLQAYDALNAHEPATTSRAFPDGGYYAMRDGWTREANYMLIDGGPHGAAALNYGHAHADALAFDLAAAGRTLLVDPGTYTYTGSQEWRDHFRSSQAHNTLTIDESSSVPAGPFRWQHVAHAQTHAWHSQPRFDYFAGTHNGYQRLAAPATHARSVLFLKRDYWIMRDRVETSGAHRAELNFHFAHAAIPELAAAAEKVVRVIHPHAGGLELYTFAAGGAWRTEMDWVSRAYGARLPAQVCKFAVTGTGAQEFITVLLPIAAGAQAATRTVRETAARGGRAFTLHVCAEQAICGDARDVLLVKTGDAAAHELCEAAQFSSDFAWTWARFGEGDELEELVLLDGRCLRFAGQELVRATERAGYVWARRAGNEWVVETDVAGEVIVRTVEALNYVRN